MTYRGSSFYHHGRRQLAQDVAEVSRAEAERRDAEAVALRERRAADAETERTRVRFTAADLAGATHVRNRWGWHKVVRVSAKSVTVETGHSWTDRIALDTVLEHRTVA